jgi:hypothetical protein
VFQKIILETLPEVSTALPIIGITSAIDWANKLHFRISVSPISHFTVFSLQIEIINGSFKASSIFLYQKWRKRKVS